MTMITGVHARDIRFPTSRGRHGSAAMYPDPDPGYSAAIRPESLAEFEFPEGAAWKS